MGKQDYGGFLYSLSFSVASKFSPTSMCCFYNQREKYSKRDLKAMPFSSDEAYRDRGSSSSSFQHPLPEVAHLWRGLAFRAQSQCRLPHQQSPNQVCEQLHAEHLTAFTSRQVDLSRRGTGLRSCKRTGGFSFPCIIPVSD